jgi:hypothetical protein
MSARHPCSCDGSLTGITPGQSSSFFHRDSEKETVPYSSSVPDPETTEPYIFGPPGSGPVIICAGP